MPARSLMVVTAVLAVLAIAAAARAVAQTPSPTRAQRAAGSTAQTPPAGAHPRIEVAPRPLLYRRCVDWYEIQHRPSGTVVFPRTHCWWVRG